MRWPKVTIRRLMALVVVAAIGTWMGLLAREVSRDKDYHFHVYAHVVNGSPAMTWDAAASPPFWPRYRRRLAGRPWRGQPVCGVAEGHLAEICSLARPEIVPSTTPGSELQPPPEITAALDQLGREWDRKHPEEAERRDKLLGKLKDMSKSPGWEDFPPLSVPLSNETS